MTAGQFREVDLDLLADYVGGALAGTPDEAVVARLIADDPAWAQTHAELTTAVTAVSRRLADWGADDSPIPGDVAARLDAVLAQPRAVDSVDSADDAPGPGARSRLFAVSGTDRTFADGRRPARLPRRRWARWVAPATVVAAVVAIASIGVGVNLPDIVPGPSDAAGDHTARQADRVGTGAPFATTPSADRLLRSGTDYTRATLAGTVAGLARTTSTAQQSGPPAVVPFSGTAPAPTAPGRTAGSPVGPLADCLNAVAGAHNRGPITVDLVDYARFEGAPALIIDFVDQTGEHWLWVADPGCGNTESGANVRYRTRVG